MQLSAVHIGNRMEIMLIKFSFAALNEKLTLLPFKQCHFCLSNWQKMEALQYRNETVYLWELFSTPEEHKQKKN